MSWPETELETHCVIKFDENKSVAVIPWIERIIVLHIRSIINSDANFTMGLGDAIAHPQF